MARGAQTYARLLIDALTDDSEDHQAVTLFEGPEGALHADIALDVPDGRLRRLGFDPRAAWRLWRTVRLVRPRLVVAHGGETLLYAAFVPLAAPLVYYRIGLLDPAVARVPRRWIYRMAARRCAAVAGVAHEVLEEAGEVLAVPAERLHLIPNGRPAELFDDTAPRGEDRVHLLWIGQLTEHKRPEWFVDLITALRARHLDVVGQVVGDGPLDADLRERAPSAGVQVLGRRDDVPALMAGADIICFTSRGDAEGMPGVLIEAALSGRPVVTTDVAGADTVVVDGVTGVVVPRHDFGAFVAAVEHLVTDPARRRAMGTAARARGIERFTMSASAAGWRGLIGELAPCR
jgi:glycosyltransferase involved in cell wall biosynthesis